MINPQEQKMGHRGGDRRRHQGLGGYGVVRLESKTPGSEIGGKVSPRLHNEIRKKSRFVWD